MARLLIATFLAIHLAGCASRRPAPVVIEQRAPVEYGDKTADGFSLKLVTYNVWGLPSWMTGAPSGRYPRIARELERLDPDIALLQEAWTAKARKSAPAHGHWSIARAAGQHTFFQQSGLVTLSRFPIMGGRFYPFARVAFPDRFVNKGVLKVIIQLPGGEKLNVWNVHLQDGGRPEIRQSQIQELVSHVQAADDGQIADLVGGDFNCTPDSSFCQQLVEALGPPLQQPGAVSPFVTWDGLSAKPDAGQTLDYIFIRGRSTIPQLQSAPCVVFVAKSLKQRLSDHFGVEAVVSLTPRPILAGALGPEFSKHSLPAGGFWRAGNALSSR